MLESYFKNETERQKQGIPPLPLSPEDTAEVCKLLEKPQEEKGALLLNLPNCSRRRPCSQSEGRMAGPDCEKQEHFPVSIQE